MTARTTSAAPTTDFEPPSRVEPTTVAEQVEAALAAAADNDGIIPIVEAGHPVLRQPTEEVDGQIDDATLTQLAEAMRKTMQAAPGVGLAAPQVGISLRMFVIEDPAPVLGEVARIRERTPTPFAAIVNSHYRAVGDEQVAFYEGCLSIPGYQAVVARPRTIALTGHHLGGGSIEREITGWEARIVAHETDHLDGVLYTDLAEMRSLATSAQVARWWSQPTAAEAARALGFDLPDSPIL
ncbi:peptide deformylase [Brevibacterium luteolum]|uniref:peptide deformylase n=1 Tax=Brevibacterium luteolum TaxID=199591 RepID=UPI003B685353